MKITNIWKFMKIKTHNILHIMMLIISMDGQWVRKCHNGGFKWYDPEKYDLPDYKTLCGNKLQKGYILEVDLEYPKELHDLHNEYSCCPEQLKVTDELLPLYAKQIANDHKLKTGNVLH